MDLISREETMTAFTNEYELYQDDVNLICKIPSAFKGMTYGEVVKAIFPDAVVIVNDLNGTVRVVFSDEVWDSPYKGVSE